MPTLKDLLSDVNNRIEFLNRLLQEFSLGTSWQNTLEEIIKELDVVVITEAQNNPTKFLFTIQNTKKRLSDLIINIAKEINETEPIEVIIENERQAIHLLLAIYKDPITYQINLGFCCECGIGVEKDVGVAINCYQFAANAGSADAQFSLGCLWDKIADEAETPADKKKEYKLIAKDCYLKAVGKGHPGATCNLGCWDEEQGNYVEAVSKYKQAADHGYALAQYNLGRCYQYGLGVTVNWMDAIKCYRLAAQLGYKNVKYALQGPYLGMYIKLYCRVERLQRMLIRLEQMFPQTNSWQDLLTDIVGLLVAKGSISIAADIKKLLSELTIVIAKNLVNGELDGGQAIEVKDEHQALALLSSKLLQSTNVNVASTSVASPGFFSTNTANGLPKPPLPLSPEILGTANGLPKPPLPLSPYIFDKDKAPSANYPNFPK